jgi:hypothetical protein
LLTASDRLDRFDGACNPDRDAADDRCGNDAPSDDRATSVVSTIGIPPPPPMTTVDTVPTITDATTTTAAQATSTVGSPR